MKPQLTDTVGEDLADISIEEEKDKGALDEFLQSEGDKTGKPSNSKKCWTRAAKQHPAQQCETKPNFDAECCVTCYK